MKTMQRASVLLLGVALLNVASAKRFIVTPTKMDGSDKKVSKLTQVWKDYDMLLEKQKAWIETDKDFKEVDKKQKDLAAKIQRAGRIVQDITNLDTTIKQKEAAIKTEEDKVPAAEQKEKDADGDVAKAEAKKELDELNEHIADMRKDPALAKAREDKTAAEEFKKEADKDYTTDPAKSADDKKDLAWTKQLADLDTKVTAKAKARTDAASANQTQVDDKDPAKGVKPESGGTGYWKTELVKAATQFANNVDTLPTQATVEPSFQGFIKPLDGAWAGVTVEGFAGDVHKDNTFFISAPDGLTLEDVQKLFTQEDRGQYRGEKVPDHVFATVKEAEDKDQPSLTLDTLVKIGDSTPLTYEENNPSDTQKPLDLKDRAARINGFVIGIETVQATRTRYIPDPTDSKKPQIPDKDNEQKEVMETYPMDYLTIQGLGLDVYMGSAYADDTKFYVRDGEHGMKYEVVGNQMEMSVKQGSDSSGDSAKDKEEGGSNTWMIVAIIFIVIVVLGGLYLGYQAYNASGSLQNTDI